MPQMPKHRKAKRATVLAKRTQYLRKHYTERSHKPLFEKLKNNNSYLAKALSQEKQNCQSLFSQNIALIAEMQELQLACNTRNNVISNILNNMKEMLKMLVTMSGYMTNTISLCQEFSTSNTNLRLSSVSAERKESSRRLSTKSPAKGVVKPMVSGHTITKPTINLSRVNVQDINNSPRLSDIQEVATPNISQEIDETRSPIAVSIPITQLRYENGRTYRMPERLMISSPRVNTDDEPLLRRRNYHSKRLSGSYSRSRSNRWSGESIRNSIGRANQVGSPRVKLNDVSKLLQNAQSINIRTLINNRVYDTQSQENSDEMSHDTSGRNVVIPDTQVSIDLKEDSMYAQTQNRSVNAQTSEGTSDENIERSSSMQENSRLSQNDNANLEDPLEGPSWLFNNTLTVPSLNERKHNSLNISRANNHLSQNNSKITESSDESDSEEDMEEELIPLQNLTKRITNMQIQKKDYRITDRTRNNSLDEDAVNDSFCAMLPSVSTSDHEKRFDNAETDGTTNFTRFVTMRRGHSEIVDEETEDFTLLLSRRPVRNMHFDISELRLPVLEQSVINTTTSNEIDTEVTTAIQRITNICMPSMLNQDINESNLDPTTTIKLPLILTNDHETVPTPANSRRLNQKNKNAKTSSTRDSENHIEVNESAVTTKSKTKQKKKSKKNQDPSAAKVVLEKLNASCVKSPDDTRSSRRDNNYAKKSSQERSVHDMTLEISNDENQVSNRPKRRKAPLNLKEPSLHKKLRRDW